MLQLDVARQSTLSRLRSAMKLALCTTLLISTAAAAPVDDYDMQVFAVPQSTTLGWVVDRYGNPIHGSPSAPAPHPLVWALNHTGNPFDACVGIDCPKYGWKIFVNQGKYASMEFRTDVTYVDVVRNLGSTPDSRVQVIGDTNGRGVTIVPCTYGGCRTLGVTGSTPDHPFNYITWQNIRFETSLFSILIGTCGGTIDGISYDGWRFIDCEIDGGYDHVTCEGTASRTALLTYGLKDFVWLGGSIHNVRNEHAFYLHNNAGDVLISGADIYEVGRTALQVASRYTDGPICSGAPPGEGKVRIEGCTIADTGLDPGYEPCATGLGYNGDFHAGSSVTFSGRNVGGIEIIGNLFECGKDTFTRGLRQAILNKDGYGPPDSVFGYGSGFVMIWTSDNDNYEHSRWARIEDNVMRYEERSGDRSAITAGGIESVYISRNYIRTGSHPTAIELGRSSNLASLPPPQHVCVKQNVLRQGSAVGPPLMMAGVCTTCPQPLSQGIINCN